MEDAGSGAWMPNLINAIITHIIGGIALYLNTIMTVLVEPGWGYDLVLSSSPGFGTKVESTEIAFN
tara:strand:+ start:135 stop:332 length:198 start_codon:yes stop_codon:yes gene_type:complete